MTDYRISSETRDQLITMLEATYNHDPEVDVDFYAVNILPHLKAAPTVSGDLTRVGNGWHLDAGRGITLALLDEREDIPTDPTLLIFRGDAEEAVLTIHMGGGEPCPEIGHITLPEEDDANA